jgi:signal transduction histidine kinase
MTRHFDVLASYAHLLEQVVRDAGTLTTEQTLTDAFELGRALVANKATPDDIATIHHQAMLQLSSNNPEISFEQIAHRSTLPLLELTMAHGMAFRQQLEQRYRAEAELAARLEQSSRLEAIGTLATGIAHDFNNILGSILGYAEMTEDDLAEASSGRENLLEIRIACSRARSLIDRLLAFARQTPAAPILQDLVAQIEEALNMLRSVLPTDVVLTYRNNLTRDDVKILADPGQIQQIVMNLCINAAEAMSGHGAIDIALDGPILREMNTASTTGEICLTVADDGAGMSPEIQARVFEPFFTTKAPKGSGLGLSVIHGIVKQLGGEIVLNSRASGPNTGTTFQIYLPPAREATEQREDSKHGTDIGYR